MPSDIFSDVNNDDPEYQKRLAALRDLSATNDRRHTQMQNEYNRAMDTQAILIQRLVALTDHILPRDTIERLDYEMGVANWTKDQLEEGFAQMAEIKRVIQQQQAGLAVPARPGLILP